MGKPFFSCSHTLSSTAHLINMEATTEIAPDRPVVVVSGKGQEYELKYQEAKRSKLLADLLEQNPESTDAIPLAGVDDRELALVLEFLKKDAVEPIKQIKRPLTSPNLLEAGVPAWAVELIQRPNLTEILDLVEAGTVMRIKMLEFLGCARIASAVLSVGASRIKGVFPEIPQLTPEEERQLKEQNPFGWKQATKPIYVDEETQAAAEAAAEAAAAAATPATGGGGEGAAAGTV